MLRNEMQAFLLHLPLSSASCPGTSSTFQPNIHSSCSDACSYSHSHPDRVRGHCPDSRYLNDIWILCICVSPRVPLVGFQLSGLFSVRQSTGHAIGSDRIGARISIWCDEFIMRTKARASRQMMMAREMQWDLGIAYSRFLKKLKAELHWEYYWRIKKCILTWIDIYDTRRLI